MSPLSQTPCLLTAPFLRLVCRDRAAWAHAPLVSPGPGPRPASHNLLSPVSEAPWRGSCVWNSLRFLLPSSTSGASQAAASHSVKGCHPVKF